MKEKYLVTGACGHLGLNLISELVKRNKEIRVFVLPNDKNIKYLPENIEICYGDVTDKESLLPFFRKEEGYEYIVIHCAAIVSIASKYSELVHNVNVNGVKNIADLCLQNKVKKLIYVSSVHAIKEEANKGLIRETKDFNPDYVEGLYAKTKAEASAYVLELCNKGLNAIIVHPSGIFGPNDHGPGHLTELIIDYAKKRLTAAVSGGYDFVDVRDVVDGIMLAIEKGKIGECYLLTNKYYSVEEILSFASESIKYKKIKTYLPLWFAKLTAPLAELYYKILKQPPLYTSYSLYTLESNSNFSHEKATKELGYNPRDIKVTIDDTVKYLKENKMI